MRASAEYDKNSNLLELAALTKAKSGWTWLILLRNSRPSWLKLGEIRRRSNQQ